MYADTCTSSNTPQHYSTTQHNITTTQHNTTHNTYMYVCTCTCPCMTITHISILACTQTHVHPVTHHIQAYHTTCMNTHMHTFTRIQTCCHCNNTCASRVCTRTTPPSHTASQHNIPMIQHNTNHTMHVSRHVYALTLTHVVCAPHTRIQHTTPHHITLLIIWSFFSHFGFPSHSGSVSSCFTLGSLLVCLIMVLSHRVSGVISIHSSSGSVCFCSLIPFFCYVSSRFLPFLSSPIESCCCCVSRLLFYSRASLCASSLLFSSFPLSSAVPGELAGRGM